MSDSTLFSKLLDQYGVRFIAGVLLAITAVWVVSHTLASPGDQVSLLWGLVSYTKRSSANLEATTPTLAETHDTAYAGDWETDLFEKGSPMPIAFKHARIGYPLSKLQSAYPNGRTRGSVYYLDPSGTPFQSAGFWVDDDSGEVRGAVFLLDGRYPHNGHAAVLGALIDALGFDQAITTATGKTTWPDVGGLRISIDYETLVITGAQEATDATHPGPSSRPD